MVRIPPPLWMFLFLAIAGVASYAVPIAPGFRVLPLGILLGSGGFVLAVTAVRRFRAEGTEINPVSDTNKALIIDGPYRFTRNPMYLALVTLSLGIAFAVGTWPMFVVPLAVFAISAGLHVPLEEEKMHRQFGAAFESYRRKVRRWI